MNDATLADEGMRNRLDEGDARAAISASDSSSMRSDVAEACKIVIAATFTADLLLRPMKFWMERLEIPAQVSLASYGQLMQELLNPESALTANEHGFDILLVRIEDWVRDRLDAGVEQNVAHIRRTADELGAAVTALRGRTRASILVYLCPTSPACADDYGAVIEEAQGQLVKRLGALAKTWVWTHADIEKLYPVAQYHDPSAERLGHIPYTEEYFVAVATLMARRVATLTKPPCKVIAVDCDNTLWRGVCGEDGATGIQLTAEHIALQEMLVRQHDAGVLLCLCSKNNPEDVEAVFKANPQMPLREEHIICSRINWEAKSANLRSLAEELGLGLDSFVMIDDSPLECAEVRSGCPAVFTLQLPQDADGLRWFLNHAWVFDRVDVTGDARKRTAQYKENRARRRALEQAGGLDQFLESLELQVDVRPMERAHVARVAELIQRTNQFNLTGIRRRQSEVEALWERRELEVIVVHVRDRFGDYGLVGAVLFRCAPEAMDIDTMVLSCRALGRRVEHRIINELGRIASERGLSRLALRYVETPRNAPAREFLDKSFAAFRGEPRSEGQKREVPFVVPAQYALNLRAGSQSGAQLEAEEKAPAPVDAQQSALSSKWRAEALRLTSVAEIMAEMNHRVPGTRAIAHELVAPRTELEASIAAIWSEVLGLEQVGIHDDFFELGGDSLMAVQILARVGSVLGVELTLQDLFESPTIAAIAGTLRTPASMDSPIERDTTGGPAPLSWSQQRLWFIDRLEGGSIAYHMEIALRLKGDLRLPALQQALDTLLERHEALRTVFTESAGGPVQEIRPPGSFALTCIDLEGQPLGRDELERHCREEQWTAFDLSSGPLVRGRLLRLSASEHWLLISMHHMVSDGHSIRIMAQELSALYDAACAEREAELPRLPIQYADYARWQQSNPAAASPTEHLSFWLEHLKGAPALIELPSDRPRPAVQTYRGETAWVELGPELTAEIRSLARRSNMTTAMTLFTAWSILLSRLSGQQDIVIGMPAANRPRTELENIVGFFVNTVAVRVRLDDDPPVSTLLERVKQTMLAAYSHQGVPFEKVVEALQPARSLSHSPVFQVMLAMLGEFPSAEAGGVSMVEEEVPLYTAQFDLLLSLRDSQAGICGRLNYASDLFEPATIERWVECFKSVLEAMVRLPEQAVSRLPLLTDEARAQVVDLFNDTGAAFPADTLLHRAIEAQVDRTPDAPAVVFEDQMLTYRELDARANRLARYLHGRGVGPDQLVGICVERSLEMVVGLLGILKAGAAYVPLDPNYPSERLAHMVDDAGPSVLLTQERLKDRLPESRAEVIALDSDWHLMASYPAGRLAPSEVPLHPRQLAYVIYTSGSTGKPKGAMNEHRAVMNRLHWMQSQYQLGPGEVVLQKTPFSFDVSVWEFFWTLMTGARLVVARPQGHQDPAYLRSVIEQAGVTTLHFVPSMLQIFLDEVQPGQCMQLRHVVCSGEELPAALQRRLFERLPHVQLSNLYGPTEAAVDVTSWECRPDDPGQRVPIGRPIANVRMYVLDRHLQPVPRGVVGEVYIGGVNVGRGYWNRAQLTAERFLPDPFSTSGGARLYRTGDLGRWRADGALEYLGRNDFQVKIRGLRIELGEIEAQLNRHPQVKEAVVVAREDGRGDKRLVGYVVPQEGEHAEPPSVEALRVHLKSVLPEYMVPAAFVMLDSMPLTPNGKLDRRALPDPQMDAYTSRTYEPPRGPIEEVLAQIWQELLGVERVGRHDNFFELGGHSLLIVQMMDRLRRVGLEAELRRVYESSSLADLASALASVSQVVVPPNLIPPQAELLTPEMLTLVDLEPRHLDRIVAAVPGGAANIQDIYPLVPLQEGILFHHLFDETGGDTYVLPMLLSVRSRQRLDELIAALQAVIDRHDILRTAVLWEQLPRPVQVVWRSATLPVTQIPLRADREPLEQLREWMQPERQRLELRQAPLMRLLVAPDADGEQWYALLQFHHMTIDHVTLEAITAEVVAHLQGRAEDVPASVPYRNHVAQVLAYAKSHDAEGFFRSKLAEIDESTAPFGLLDIYGDGSQVEEVHAEMDATLARRVRVQARRAGVSAATLFHAAWALVVGCTSGRDDVVFGSVLLGRLQGNAGAQRILGMFINTLPLRLKLRDATARELIEHTQRELIELLGHEQASLAVAQRCSSVVGTRPLFTALLNYRHSVPNPEAEWSNADGVRLLFCQERTNYPITFSVDDLGQGFNLTAKTDARIDARRLIDYLNTALSSLVAALEQDTRAPAVSLQVLPAAERQQVLRSFNPAPVPCERLIHEVFEEQVRRTPDALAVVYGEQSLTFAELNARANQLARELRDRGVGPDRLVALCVERGLDMVVGMMGILKAGGAYVPLDPDYPLDRLRFMLQDAAPPVLLTQAALRDRLAASTEQMVMLDSDWRRIERHSTENLDPAAVGLQPRHLAYVIYTSGSTGRPKGVMVEHRNVLSLWQGLERLYRHARDCRRVAVNASFNFDASVKQFIQLLSGRSIVLVPQECRWDAALMLRFMQEQQVDCIDCTPWQLRSWLTAGLAARSCPLRMALVGGEPIDAELWQVLASHNTIDFFNVYGPTESTVDTTFAHVNADRTAQAHIGRPMENRQVYILDSQGQPVPVGVVGEICIGGAGVARGYLNRPDLTTQRFVPEPFSDEPSARLYKSGDLGRWRSDGTVEYLGRIDHQVKVRGFRIELGEIEAQLERLESVKDAVALVREDVPGDRRIVAYVVAHEGAQVHADTLRAEMKEVLPDYMVPAAFVMIESVPLTPNGKLDRRALPAPDLSAYTTRVYEPPQGEVEEILCGIWQSLLRVERVGRRDNFFELGGHSLLIVQMMERLRRVGLSIQVRNVFDTETLAELAGSITRESGDGVEVPPNLIPAGAAAITPQMLTLLELEQQHIDSIVATVPGGAANVQDIYPLAPLQEGILFHHLMQEQGDDAYVTATLLAVSSRARLDELIAALQSAIDRHDVLRTAVLWEQLPRPVQVVYRTARLVVEEVDLDPGRDRMAQIRALMRARQRMDLRQAPLIRMRIAQDRDGRWLALLQMHHIVEDATSMSLLVAEVVAQMNGQPSPASSAVPYRNHVAHVLFHTQANDAEAFFRGKLADVEEPTAPFGVVNAYEDSHDIDEATELLDPALAQSIRMHARRLGVSAATIVHAAWGLVIAHTSNRTDDVVFGSVLLGRLQGNTGAERMLGLFINTLPLRLRLDAVSAAELVQQVQRELVELLGHEYVSLALAQRCSGVVGSLPLFTALLNYRHYSAARETGWSAAQGVELLGRHNGTNYAVTMSVDDLGEGFELTAQTVAPIGAARVVGYLRTALASLTRALHEAPESPALSLSILPAEERSLLVESLNATARDYAREKSVDQLFEEQAQRTPHELAVMHDDESLTYAQLDARANQVAGYLRCKGVGTGDLVGLCMERRIDMVVGMLAALKAGAAYLPLDPNQPSARLEYMLEDGAPRVVLAHHSLLSLLPAGRTETIAIDQCPQIEAFSPQRATGERAATGRDLVYVIYTSGSTGKPKGTAMPHGAMVNLIEWHRATFGSKPVRVLQFAALSFDVAFQETFSTLCTGGTLVLLDEWVRRDSKTLVELLNRYRIERLFLPPLFLQSLAEYYCASGIAPESLKDVITAGEQLRIGREIVSLFRRLDGCRLHNHYGPTETHVVTALTLPKDPDDWPVLPSIGRPIANTQIYVLDAQGVPTPVGVAGEIYIAGAGVARGYLNRPELAQERFLPDPFSANPDARMYKTGDLGRWCADGTLEYLGRNDDQVKIRGYRVELGEIEAQLARHPRVKEVAVVARDDSAGGKRLVAYVTSRTEEALDARELRDHLKCSLPEHMLPSAFVVLESMPLTPSGKLHRRALPAPELDAYGSAEYDPPVGATEQELAAVWRELLQVERVGRQDNFFELGGHSLLALKLLLKINAVLGANLRITDVYRSPKLAELAERIEGGAVADELVELSSEAALDPALTAIPGAQVASPPSAILLTGATGFVGRFLLAQLLQESHATIYCLVRARSSHEAEFRVRTTLQKWDLWEEEYEERIVPIAADLRAPMLGLDDATYRLLSQRVDSIFHCATSMNHLETYTMARPVNVDAAKELVRLATRHRPKAINYISTLGIFTASATEARRTIDERSPIQHERHPHSRGYLASKWVGEKVFMSAAERGIACNIFRLGLVWADTQQGRFDELQNVYRFLKSSLLAGVGIENFRYPLPPTPVDYVARAITFLARQHVSGCGVFHISSPRQLLEDVYGRCAEIAGVSLELVPYYDWICELKRLHHEGYSLPAVPLVDFAFSLDRKAFEEHQRSTRSSGNIQFDCSRTHAELERAGITAPVLDDVLLRTCIEDMLERDADLRGLNESALRRSGRSRTAAHVLDRVQ
jgi:amino acid adenylation domain-containing protein/FkbH-like protein/thioester reductase-like protein